MTINILEYLEKSFELYSDKIALEDENRKITYRQYISDARAIGSYIFDYLKLKNINNNITNNESYFFMDDFIINKPIIVLINRNVESVIAFMGCVYSGNFYVPLDATMPKARVMKIINTLEPSMIINASGKNVDLDVDLIKYEDAVSKPVLLNDLERLKAVRSQMTDIDPLYAIFTSGSTGVPKGVLISHKGVIDLVEQFSTTFQFDSNQVFANQAPFDFDVSVKDIYNSLKNGATLQIIPKRLFTSPVKLVEYLNEKRVDTMIWAVSALRIIADTDVFSKISFENKIRYIMFSGEIMPVKTLNYLRSYMHKTTFVNLYGPTEITCNCTYYIVPDDFNNKYDIPIGTNFRNSRVFLFDSKGRLVQKQNVKGEICISGSCLALGYYNNIDKTRNSFRTNECIPQYPVNVYYTGDLGYYNDEWQLVFASRKDFQIKHMGHRIELGEIEAVLNDCNFLNISCCIYDDKSEKIVCFYESSNECKKEIVMYLKNLLPKYMWPNVYKWYEKLPYNTHGKIDRVKLKGLLDEYSF